MKQKILKGNKMDNYIALGEICEILTLTTELSALIKKGGADE